MIKVAESAYHCILSVIEQLYRSNERFLRFLSHMTRHTIRHCWFWEQGAAFDLEGASSSTQHLSDENAFTTTDSFLPQVQLPHQNSFKGISHLRKWKTNLFKLETLFMLTSFVPVLLLQHIFRLFDQNNKWMKSRLDRKDSIGAIWCGKYFGLMNMDRSIQIDKVLCVRKGECLPVFNHLECQSPLLAEQGYCRAIEVLDK